MLCIDRGNTLQLCVMSLQLLIFGLCIINLFGEKSKLSHDGIKVVSLSCSVTLLSLGFPLMTLLAWPCLLRSTLPT